MRSRGVGVLVHPEPRRAPTITPSKNGALAPEELISYFCDANRQFDLSPLRDLPRSTQNVPKFSEIRQLLINRQESISSPAPGSISACSVAGATAEGRASGAGSGDGGTGSLMSGVSQGLCNAASASSSSSPL